MYLYGASGHAKVIMDVLQANGQKIEGLVDDNPAITHLLGYPVFHGKTNVSPLIISIGDNRTRKQIAQRLQVEYGTAIHPSAIVSPHAAIDSGTVVMQKRNDSGIDFFLAEWNEYPASDLHRTF